LNKKLLVAAALILAAGTVFAQVGPRQGRGRGHDSPHHGMPAPGWNNGPGWNRGPGMPAPGGNNGPGWNNGPGPAFPDRQLQNRPRLNQPNLPAPEKTTIEGKLAITEGVVTLASGGTTYRIGNLLRWAGFIDGLKEGAQVKLEGWARPAQSVGGTLFFNATALTLNDKV
jgi:hypothetical protein